MKKVVLLVDNKRRDLRGITLISHHLKKRGVVPFLEPLEAYRGAIAAHKPDMMVFNHLLANHLADYSGKLAQMGIKVAVLPNESLLYNKDVMLFNCRRYNSNVHADLYFCWNEIQQECIAQNGYDLSKTRVEVVGNPKFDFYFEPWSKIFKKEKSRQRRQVLICTNFGLANFKELPRIQADKLFDIWKKHIPIYERYWEAIESNHRSRARFLDFLHEILKANKFEIILRPHPGEPASFYRDWLEKIPSNLQKNIRLAVDDSIYSLILDCDIEISCETCTTAIESWICHKPTIELTFEKHPMFYHEEVANLNVECDDPSKIVAEIEKQLSNPEPMEFREKRNGHLQKWCHNPHGDSCEQVANAIAEVVRDSNPVFSLDFTSKRRGMKLHFLKMLGLPYNYDPFLKIKSLLFPKKYGAKTREYEKTVKPADIALVEKEIADCVSN